VSSKLKAAIAAVVVAGIGLAAGILKRAIGRPTVRDENAREVGDMASGRAGDADPPHDASRDELYAEAKRRGIEGRSKMTKAELQAALAKGSPP
jgi:hypothetical protein